MSGPSRRPGGRRRRRALVLAVLALVVLAVGTITRKQREQRARRPRATPPATAGAAPSTGAVGAVTLPTDELVFDSDRSGSFQIYAMTTRGTDVRPLTDMPDVDAFWPRVSPDRTHILFYRVPRGAHNRRGEYQRASLWVMRADGRDAHRLIGAHERGWTGQGHAEWSPDGREIVMFGGPGRSQIYVTDAEGRDPRRITDGPSPAIDPSWSPDGRTIVFVACPGPACAPSAQEVFTVPRAGGGAVRLTDDAIRDQDPYFSPDGTRLAFLSQTAPPAPGRPAGVWNIRMIASGGGPVRLVTADENVNSKPAWSADGRTIYFHRLVYGRGGFQVWSLDVGTGAMRPLTVGQPGVNEYPGT